MKKICGILLLMFMTMLNAYSFEDCIISTNGKMTNIRIENNKIIDVYPLITLMNDKNTLIVHPLNAGNTKFSILKNNNEKVVFNVSVTNKSTKIDDIEGFDIQELDNPPDNSDNEIDNPPVIKEGEK